MQARKLPDIEYLRQCLRYDPDTGHLYWIERPLNHFVDERARRLTNTRWAGKRAFTAKSGIGGFVGHLNGKRYLAHRIAYALGHGVEPPQFIDHINGNPEDNRLKNLRSVSHAENSRNRARNYNATNPAHGVYERNGKWLASIKIEARTLSIGLFATLEEAMAARIGAERALGYHENHGRKSSKTVR